MSIGLDSRFSPTNVGAYVRGPLVHGKAAFTALMR